VTARLTVGVAIPVRNGERYLEGALRSVLEQTRPVNAVVVVDDGSTDGSAAIASATGPTVRVVTQRGAGVGPARSRAAGLLATDVLVMMDADDLLPPRSIEVRLAVLETRPEVNIVFGHLCNFRRLGPGGVPVPLEPPRAAPLAGALAVRRAAYERVGPFAAGLRVTEGLDWLLRARELKLEEVTLPDLVQWRRLHGANSSFVHRGERAELARVLKASLDRRRGRA
jgi:glycosyltransferase involved in cell wall biosynthesis